MEPVHAVLRLANHHHLLLFKLVNTINAPFFYSVSAYLLSETGRIAGKRLGQVFFVKKGVDKSAYHGMLAGTYQVQILALYLVHHVFHFREAHYAGNHVASYHKGGDKVSKALVYHKVPGIGQYRGVQSRNIAFKVVKSVSAGFSGTVKVNSVTGFHNIGVVRHLEVGHLRLSEFLYFNVLAVVPAHRYAVVDNVRYNEHSFPYLSA